MKIKKIIFASILSFCLSISLYAQNIGEKVYKELLIDGKTVNKWCEIKSIKECNEKGFVFHIATKDSNIIYNYDKNDKIISDSNGGVWEYDDAGNNTVYKNKKANYEIIYDYDKEGNKIHSLDSDKEEIWNEYDNSNSLLHAKINSIKSDSTNMEVTDQYYEYDKNKNIIHQYNITNNTQLSFEIISSYNQQNQLIYKKTITYEDEKPKYINEEYYQYYQNGKLYFYQSKSSSNITWNYHYQYYSYDNYKCRIDKVDWTHGSSYTEIIEVEYWDEEKTIPKAEIIYRLQ